MKEEIIETLKSFCIASLIVATSIAGIIGCGSWIKCYIKQQIVTLPPPAITIKSTIAKRFTEDTTGLVNSDFGAVAKFQAAGSWTTNYTWQLLRDKHDKLVKIIPKQMEEISLIANIIVNKYGSDVPLTSRTYPGYLSEDIIRINRHNYLQNLVQRENGEIADIGTKMNTIESECMLNDFYRAKTN